MLFKKSHTHFDTFSDLRRETFNLTLLVVGLSAWVWLALGTLYFRKPVTLIIDIAIPSICAFCYWLRSRHLTAAIYCLIAGIWACNAIIVHHFRLPLFLYQFSLIILIAGVLMPPLPTTLVTIISSVFIVIVEADGGALWGELSPLLMAWSTLIVTFIISHSSSQALAIAWGYQDYAVQQLGEVRDHRAKLVQLTRSLQETSHDLERANTQLRLAYKAAEEARRLKAQFAANVSHELRTPINLIVGFSEMMMMAPEAYGKPLPAAYRADLNSVYRNAKYLQSLISDVLDISQIEAGRMTVVKEETDLRQIVLEAADLARDLVTSRGLVFHVRTLDKPLNMSLDRIRIRQVILNLLNNAARFTDEGSITLTTVLKEKRVEIRVTDTGIGISREELARVFEEFHQIDGSLARQRGGTGLGLALSKWFVELHGGRIWAESAGIAGQGSTFVVELPLHEDPFIQRESSRAVPTDRDWGRYYVVLDSDPSIIQLFERYTRQHRVVGVHSVEEAIRLTQSIYPTALVVDSNLRQRVEAVVQGTPIIACPMPSGQRALEKLGITEEMIGPVPYPILLETLEKLPQPIQRVLIISRNRDIARMLSRALQGGQRKYEVSHTHSRRNALNLLRQKHPDIVVLDIALTDDRDLDNLSIAQQIKADPALHRLPVVITAAKGATDAIIPSAEHTVELIKMTGFRPIELVRCVEAIVDSLVPDSVQVS